MTKLKSLRTYCPQRDESIPWYQANHNWGRSPRSNANVKRFMQHLTSCLTKCEDTLYRNLKDHLPSIALTHYHTAFNSAMKCTPFEAMYGLRAKTITEAGASPRLHITAKKRTGLTGLQEPD